MDWFSFLIIGHLVGAILGVGGATFAEIFAFKIAKEGFNETAAGFLKTTYFLIRLGLVITVLSGAGFLLLYRISGGPNLLADEKFLAKMTIVLVIIFGPVLMQWKIVPTSVGGPLSLVSWWGAAVLGSWRTLAADYFTIMGVYLVFVFAAVGILNYFKNRVKKPA